VPLSCVNSEKLGSATYPINYFSVTGEAVHDSEAGIFNYRNNDSSRAENGPGSPRAGLGIFDCK
jgi:hypothetical protein